MVTSMQLNGAKKVGKVLVMLLVNTTTERYVTQHGKSRL